MTNFFNTKNIEVGRNFCIGENCIIDASDSKEGVFIGNEVLIASNLFIRTANHNFDLTDEPIRLQGHRTKVLDYLGKRYSIVIEDNVWISQNVTILSGVKIGKGAIIGAGALIIKDVPPNSIVGTEPAKVIRQRTKNISK